jgi:hypothetical protein
MLLQAPVAHHHECASNFTSLPRTVSDVTPIIVPPAELKTRVVSSQINLGVDALYDVMFGAGSPFMASFWASEVSERQQLIFCLLEFLFQHFAGSHKMKGKAPFVSCSCCFRSIIITLSTPLC